MANFHDQLLLDIITKDEDAQRVAANLAKATADQVGRALSLGMQKAADEYAEKMKAKQKEIGSAPSHRPK